MGRFLEVDSSGTVTVSHPPPIPWRNPLPWYWTDEIADTLVRLGRLDEATLPRSGVMPVGLRRSEDTLEEAAVELHEEGEIPLAA
jgi:hypothetical protein